MCTVRILYLDVHIIHLHSVLETISHSRCGSKRIVNILYVILNRSMAEQSMSRIFVQVISVLLQNHRLIFWCADYRFVKEQLNYLSLSLSIYYFQIWYHRRSHDHISQSGRTGYWLICGRTVSKFCSGELHPSAKILLTSYIPFCPAIKVADDIFIHIRLSYHFLPGQVRSGQVWEQTPEQRVAASTFRRYALGLRLAIAQADARFSSPCPYPSDRTPPHATMKRVGSLSAWFSPTYIYSFFPEYYLNISFRLFHKLTIFGIRKCTCKTRV